MYFRFSLQLATTFILCLALASCGSIDDMKKNAEDASKNSGDAAVAAQQSREEIANGRMMNRASGSSASRRDALEAMENANTFQKKIVESAKYFKAFEFQVWTGQKYDTPEYRQALYSSAIKEFFRDLVEVYHGDMVSRKSPSPFKVIKKNKHLNVLALATTLHITGEIQKLVTVERLDDLHSSTSMYDLIKTGLTKDKLVKDGKLRAQDLVDYEFQVSVYSEEAIALLQARANMMLTLVLSQISPIKDKKSKALTLQNPLAKKYESSFHKLSPTAQDMINNKYLKAALGVKTFLNSINIEVKVRDDISKIYSKMMLPKANSSQDLQYQESLKQFFKF